MGKKTIVAILLLCGVLMTPVGLCKDKGHDERWIPVIEDLINGKEYPLYVNENYIGGFLIEHNESGKMVEAWVTTDKGIKKLPGDLITAVKSDVGKPINEKDRFHWKLKRLNYTLHIDDDQEYIDIGIVVAPLAGHGMRYEVQKDKDNKKRIIISSGKMTWIS